jgi:hypothetical protein
MPVLPKHRISPTIREQIRNVQARLEQLEEGREKKSKEDYECFKRFFNDWIAELQEWLQRAEWYETDDVRLDEWMEEVEADLRECLKKRTLH